MTVSAAGRPPGTGAGGVRYLFLLYGGATGEADLTPEQLGSVYVVDCASAAEALALARRMPASPGLTVEIREIQEV